MQNVLEAFALKLRENTIKWFTDNQSVKFIVTNGSKKRHSGQFCALIEFISQGM